MDQRYWQKADKGDVYDAIGATLNALDDQLQMRSELHREHLALYMNDTYEGLRPGVAKAIPKFGQGGEQHSPIKLNAIQSIVDTLASKIAVNRPKPKFLTSGGAFSDRYKAKQLEKFVDAVFYLNGFYEEAKRVFIDAAIFGTGCLKVFALNGKIKMERVFIDEIIVDEQSCLTSDPRSIFQRRDVPAEVLVRQFPKFEAQIRLAASNQRQTPQGAEWVLTDMVEVVEGWHLRSGPGADDGRHVIAIDGADLFDEPYTADWLPFVVLRWQQVPIGWYGQGLVQQLKYLQRELDKLLLRIQQAMHMYAITRTYMRKGSVDKKHFRNQIGDIIEVEEGADFPRTDTPPPMANQVFEHVWQLYTRMFETSGVSQLSATSRKPAGVESGVALRTLLDTETQRFGLLVRDWEEMAVEAARLVVRTAKEMGSVKVKHVERDWFTPIDFSEVNLDEEAFVLKVYPTNLLPAMPAGRLAMVEDLMRMGIIQDQKVAMSLLDFPDLDRFKSLRTASIDLIDRSIELILDEGRQIRPVPYMDKEYAKGRVQNALLEAQLHDPPPERIQMLEDWLEELLEPAPAPPPMGGSGMGQSPQMPLGPPQGPAGMPVEMMPPGAGGPMPQ